MKKLRVLVSCLLASLLAGCEFNAATIKGLFKKTTLSFEEGQNVSQVYKKGTLGDFNLVAPATGSIVNKEPTFSWTESENAITYTLEVCSSDSFVATSSAVAYAKETNISATSFKLSSSLKFKNTNYYWRVTAVNEYNTKSVGKDKVSEVWSFFYQVESAGEIAIEVGEAEDWALHKVGSVADISIDHNDFFGTGDQDSLKITFEKENTSQGPVTSIGWVDVQKAVEQDFYGTDAFYCNFYYMGHDSTILIRIIDQDGELWYKQVKFTQDARQVALLKFEEFTLRTKDTTVQNEVFNYEHIQAIEVCFEQTFGDGCCIISGIKCVNYEKYSDLFIEKFNFKSVPESEWIAENYKFLNTISQDGSTLTIEYSTTAGFNDNPKGMGSYGYGFDKIPVNRYFTDGNAIKVKIKYTGYSSNVNAIIRIYEPDQDRWSFTQPFADLTAGEYKEYTVPFMAFDQSSIVEGKRQFYYISQLQFGLNNCYGSGTLSYKDFQIVTLPPVSQNPRVVEEDGIIDNFDTYTHRNQTYESWETSVANKDEGIFISSEDKFNNGTNVYTGKFTYKSDMSMATYDIYTDVKAQGLNAIKFLIKDRSVPNTNSPYTQTLTGEDVSPLFVLQIVLKDGRWYRYQIDKAPRKWTEYVIPFSMFELYDGMVLDDSDPVESQNVVNFAFGMQFFYKINYAGKEVAYPLYTQNNPVFIDEIMFTSASESSVLTLEKEIHPDENGKSVVDDFEYDSQELLAGRWFGMKHYEYEKLTLSDDVSSEGKEHSMKLDYKGYNSPGYAHYPTIGSDVLCKAISLDIKGDGLATIYVNLYIKTGSTTRLYRHTITNAATGWNRYVIGFASSNFSQIEGGTQAIGDKAIQNLAKLTFGIVNNSGTEVSSIYVDNILFLNNGVTFDTHTITPIA